MLYVYVHRAPAAYPATVCPVSVRAVGPGPVAEQVKTLVTNIFENELESLREAFKDHPFLMEAGQLLRHV